MPHEIRENGAIQRDARDMAQECAHLDGQREFSIEQKFANANDEALPLNSMLVKRKSRIKEDGPLTMICEWAVGHQIGLSLNLLLLLGLTHLCFPRARKQTRKFFELSYYNAESGNYTAGWDDACMVFFWIVMFTGLRASFMDLVFTPMGQWGGITKKKSLVRFAEQAWMLVYYTVFWSLGMYIMQNSDYWLSSRALWANWPQREIGGLLKWYTLVQFAFWLQQIFVINIEKRRKDHWQMFSHHIITCTLLFTSYGYHQTKVANLVLCLMDIVDIFLPAAKCLKYLGFSTVCDIVFGIFMITWVMARHVLYLLVCYSVWKHLPEETNYGCYRGKSGAIVGPFPQPDRFMHLVEPFANPDGVVCFNHGIKWAFLSALLALQCITVLWFGMIVKVALKVVRGVGADDTRSDDESDEAGEEAGSMHLEKLDPIEVLPLEEEVGVESINLKGRVASGSRRYKKSTSSASGVTLPGHGDRKELLGRIGCERGV
ncbi:MAG: sphingosine N-acyltransferase lag1 [Claussenomyces sp. TS43310]|nr:MAG: sphingosine N-acyltransferase lag1 [Claussenomyces sp. TS43310]